MVNVSIIPQMERDKLLSYIQKYGKREGRDRYYNELHELQEKELERYPLLNAVLEDDKNAFDRQLRLQTNPNITFEEWSTPLYSAVSRGNIYMVEQLLKAGADPNLTNGDNFTPLMAAAIVGLADIVHLLLRAGVHINAVNPLLKTTALSHAVQYRRSKVAKMLLQVGADPNINANSEYAPLKMARRNADRDMITWLKLSGAK